MNVEEDETIELFGGPYDGEMIEVERELVFIQFDSRSLSTNTDIYTSYQRRGETAKFDFVGFDI